VTTPSAPPVLELVARELERARDVVLTTHITPDGDALGSAVALLRHLRRRGKAAHIVNCSAVPQTYRFLVRGDEFSVFQPGHHERRLGRADVILATDLGGPARLGRMQEPILAARATRILIDHHHCAEGWFDLELVDRQASSTAEITHRLLERLGADMTADIAEPIYVGLITDTGNFCYPATTPGVHRLAARLLECGVDPHAVWRRIACQVPVAKMRFLGRCLQAVALAAGGRIAHLLVTPAQVSDAGIPARDAFEVVNHLLHIRGVEVGAYFFALDDQRTKVSLRSSGPVDVSRIATARGGGGHRGAAGFTVEGQAPAQVADAVLAEIASALGEGNG
jgi:phosphoesterase RecJ-like protein